MPNRYPPEKHELVKQVCDEFKYDRKRRWVRAAEKLERMGIRIIPDTLRKYYRSHFGDDSGGVSSVSSGARPIKLPDAVEVDREIERLKSENRLLKAKYREALKRASLADAISAVLKESVEAFPPVPVPAPEPVDTSRYTVEEAVLLLSDWEIGDVITPGRTLGLGSYNFERFKDEYKYLVDKTIDFLFDKLRGYKFQALHIPILGDMVIGIIHESNWRVADGTPYTWVYGGAYVLAQGILQLAQLFPKVYIYGVPGNHGRLEKKKSYKEPEVSFDYFLYETLGLLLLNQPNVECDFPASLFMIREINGHKFFFWHGDGIRMYRRTPWYGIEDADKEMSLLLQATDQHYDYMVIGHFHDKASIERAGKGEVIINGSASGVSEYSIGAIRSGRFPSQMLFGVHRRHGISWQFSIKLKDAPRYGKRGYIYDPEVPISKQARDLLFSK